MPKVDEAPPKIKPYKQHRVELTGENEKGAIGNCPFCEGSGKFFIFKDTGQYGCRVCPEKGNLYSFIRKVHASGKSPQSELEIVSEERKIDVDTLKAWGLVKSSIDNEWVMPTYSLPEKGKEQSISNLYRWAKWYDEKAKKWKRKLQGTYSLDAGLYGLQFWDNLKPEVFVTEGPWDGMKLWEVLRKYRVGDDGNLSRTLDVSKSLYSKYNVLAVPGTETFKDYWTPLFIGKSVIIAFDNDHPKTNKQTGLVTMGGFDGTKRLFRKLHPAAKYISVLKWGNDGYDESLPDGFDVRDLLNSEV